MNEFIAISRRSSENLVVFSFTKKISIVTMKRNGKNINKIISVNTKITKKKIITHETFFCGVVFGHWNGKCKRKLVCGYYSILCT